MKDGAVFALQVVNHIRPDELRVLAVFDVAGWGGPCQLIADVERQEIYAMGWMCVQPNGYWVRLAGFIKDEAWAIYNQKMTGLFGAAWRKIKDGTTRMMEWSPVEP